MYEPVDGDAEVVAPASTSRTADPVTAAIITVPYDTVWIFLEKHEDDSSWSLPDNSMFRRNGTRIEYKTKIFWDPNRPQFGHLEISPGQAMKDLERLRRGEVSPDTAAIITVAYKKHMDASNWPSKDITTKGYIQDWAPLEKDKSTEENRKFWEYVEKTAQKAKKDEDWQRGAVCPRGDPIVPQSSKGYNGYDMIGDDDDDDDQDVKHTHKIISTLEVPSEFSCSRNEMEAIVLPWFCAEKAQICQSNREWPCCAEPNCRLPLEVRICMGGRYQQWYLQLILACEKSAPPEPSVHLGPALIQTFLKNRGY